MKNKPLALPFSSVSPCPFLPRRPLRKPPLSRHPRRRSRFTSDSADATSGFVTATVEVGGYARECSMSHDVTVSIAAAAEYAPSGADQPEMQKPPR